MKISIPVLIDGVKTMKDKTVKISLVTQELPASEMGIVFSLANDLASCVLASVGTTIKDEDLKDIKDFPEERSPSRRLRGVLYVLWEQQGKKDDFELFYRRSMERLIERIKNKLC